MTLEERLQKRLQLWRSAAREHQMCMEELDPESEDPKERAEWFDHKLEAEVFERCITEVIADLSARSSPPKTRLPAEYYKRAQSDRKDRGEDSELTDIDPFAPDPPKGRQRV